MNVKFGKTLIAGAMLATLGLGAGNVAAAQYYPEGKTGHALAATPLSMWKEMRATRLIGTDVRNAAGERLGDIYDLAIDPNTDSVRYAILSFGGFIGLGDKLFAYPLGKFRSSADGDSLVLDVSRESLRAAPGFDQGNWPEWGSRYFRDVAQFFGITESVGTAGLWSARTLIGEDVNARGGADIGHVKDVIVDLSSGNVQYAVVELDRIATFPDRHVGLPLSRLRWSRDRSDLVADMTRAQISALPTLVADRYVADRSGMTYDHRQAAMRMSTAQDILFDRLDANRDGRLDQREVVHNRRVEKMRHSLDRNNDGSISREEFEAYQTR